MAISVSEQESDNEPGSRMDDDTGREMNIETNLQPAVQRGEGRRNSERESGGVRGRARGRRSEGRRGSQEEEVKFGKKKIYQNLNVEDSSSILHTYIYLLYLTVKP